MELIIQILMLFIVINTILKLSFWKIWQVVLFSTLSALFVILACPYAILQSKTQSADYLVNTKIMQDVAVLITLESVICFAFCFLAFGKQSVKQSKWWMHLFYWYSSLLIFPVLFYILTQIIFAMPGIDFTTISYIMALIVFITFPLLSLGIRYFYSESELRLEVYFLVTLFVFIIGLITTVNGNVTYTATGEPTNIKAIIFSLGLFCALFLIGFVWNKIKWLKTSNNKLLK